jgi:hypothetical protein
MVTTEFYFYLLFEEKLTREIVLAGLCTPIANILSQDSMAEAHYSALYALLKISLAGLFMNDPID